ncbi:E3 ubiquitin-protein ligase znrf2 isoform X3 [Hetaerina americana]|uniref:E3 ubiquitin-protein ligase znrf2 isoform X3 n=1 Tax=Hetaerina americana TaxID=62018 RepID=UPI003A7F2BAB
MAYRRTVVTTTSTLRGSLLPSPARLCASSRIHLHHSSSSFVSASARVPLTRRPVGIPAHRTAPDPDRRPTDVKRLAKLLKEQQTENGIKCPVCSKFVLPDDIECHLVMCLTKPRLSYNEDVLGENKGECVICLEDLMQGDTIARLPCLCIYHKGCIDRWFEVNRSCPEHPGD